MLVLLKYLSGELVPLEVPRDFTRYQLYRLVWEQRHSNLSFQALTLMTDEEELYPDLNVIHLTPEQMIYVLIQNCYVDLTIDYAVDAMYEYQSYDKFVVRVFHMNAEGEPIRVEVIPFYYGNGEIYVGVDVIDYSEYGEVIQITERARRLSRVTELLPEMEPHSMSRMERRLTSQWTNYMLI